MGIREWIGDDIYLKQYEEIQNIKMNHDNSNKSHVTFNCRIQEFDL